MYNISKANSLNTDPWDIPLYKRVALIKESILKHKKVALLIYEKADSSTFRYRGYNIYQSTLKSDKWQSVFFFEDEYNFVLDLLNEINLLVIIRVKWTHMLDQIIKRAKQNDIKVLFDIDDLIFDINYFDVVMNAINVEFTCGRDYEFWFSNISRIGLTASKADGFIAPNEILASKLHENYDKPYKVIPNSLNEEQVLVSEKYRVSKSDVSSESPFSIGYFSGSPTHQNDFNLVSCEIRQLLDEYDDIELLIVGYMDFDKEMQEYIENNRVRFIPHVDFIELQRLIATVDINIVPLVNNIFTNCKSELKFFEAAIVNTITLASPTYAYKNSIVDGSNGFLCTEGQWYPKIKDIYNGKVDLKEITECAYSESMEKYQGSVYLRQIEDCYDSFF